tara:strand:+ start:259 stop:450 length:192 start_codon:yes stop_codon:yes gene_type:complete
MTLKFIKNIFAVVLAVLAIWVILYTVPTLTETMLHYIHTTCNYILATLLGIWSYLLADWTDNV